MENDVLIEYLKDGRERLCLTYMGNHRCDGCPMDFPNMVTCPIQEAIYTLALKTNAIEGYGKLQKELNRLTEVSKTNYEAFESASKERNEAQAQVRELENQLAIFRGKYEGVQQKCDKLDDFIMSADLIRLNPKTELVKYDDCWTMSKDVFPKDAIDLVRMVEDDE